jgi:hypothetical protein
MDGRKEIVVILQKMRKKMESIVLTCGKYFKISIYLVNVVRTCTREKDSIRINTTCKGKKTREKFERKE